MSAMLCFSFANAERKMSFKEKKVKRQTEKKKQQREDTDWKANPDFYWESLSKHKGYGSDGGGKRKKGLQWYGRTWFP